MTKLSSFVTLLLIKFHLCLPRLFQPDVQLNIKPMTKLRDEIRILRRGKSAG